MSDHDLLRAYAHAGSQAAFATLVGRHLNLVYSVARRVTRSPHLAEEVAQTVFADLARQAGTLGTEVPVVAWLHVVSRRKSVDAVRRESRRQLREEIAANLSASTMHPPNANWPEIEPLLDEAVESLPPADRTAILLRFFENKSLREVGAALGTSDDAAQKRVTRALEQLREALVRRGVAVTAAGLATNISANALLTAPAALGGGIVAAAIGAASAAPIAAAGVASKLLLGLGTAAAVAFAVYRAQPPAPTSSSSAPPEPRFAATSVAQAPPNAAEARPTPASRAQIIDERIALLRQLLAELPAQRIPEIRMLMPADWSEIAGRHELDSPADIRAALAELRSVGRKKFALELQAALKRFTALSAGEFPDAASRLAPLLALPADAEMLARYDLLRAGKLGEASEHLFREQPTSDLITSVGLEGWHMKNNPDHPAALGESDMEALGRAMKAIGRTLDPDGDGLMENLGRSIVENLDSFKVLAENATKALEPVYGDGDAVGEAMKDAALAFVAAQPDAKLENLGQLLPHLRKADQFAEAVRPMLAHILYMHEHEGRVAANPAELRPYLERTVDPTEVLRLLKVTLNPTTRELTVNYSWNTGEK